MGEVTGEAGHQRRLRGAARVAAGDVISCAHREAGGGGPMGGARGRGRSETEEDRRLHGAQSHCRNSAEKPPGANAETPGGPGRV